MFWGQDPEGGSIAVNVSTIEDAYDEIVKWRKNTFLVPYGKIGREFIDKFTEHINDWNNGSQSQHVALKAAIILLAVGLQKPSQKSKANEHQECLGKRLDQWNRGEIGSLLREGRAIQRRLISSPRQSKPDSARVFANLVMSEQMNSALWYLSGENGGGVLPLTDDVMKQLREKHPEAQEAQLGVDSNGFRRMMACKSFRKSGTNLCSALATMTRKLCTEYVDPRSIEAILANRLIPLDKGEGKVRPIGVGEVLRRIMGKCVMSVTKQDVIDACGSMQVCAGHKSGSEAAVHAMRSIFDADDTDAVLLIDASNAFNSLNRAAALHNITVLCPSIATYAINTYRRHARLFIMGGKELRSAEGTTQGDPVAMSLYAVSLQPLIAQLQASSSAKQCWFADDATGSGTLENTEGHKHLGAALGSRSYFEEYVGEKVEDWVSHVVKLAEFAVSQPQASYAAFTFGLRHRWTYFLRTLPDHHCLARTLRTRHL